MVHMFQCNTDNMLLIKKIKFAQGERKGYQY